MAVLLKNLVARTPQTDDLSTISDLIVACENAGYGEADSVLGDLLSHWQQADFHLANDAWVIVTTRGQIVGFACIWHNAHAQLSTYVCTHPAYRQRGIGTVLLRLVEVRARQCLRQALPGEHVALQIQVNSENEGVQHLLEREGYKPGRQFLRISFALAEDSSSSSATRNLRADVHLDHQGQFAATSVADRDGLCSVRFYRTHEKELRPASAREALPTAILN